MKAAIRFAGMALTMVWIASACDSVGQGDETNVTVSFSTRPVAANGSLVAAADPITVNGHTLDLQSADITFSHIKLDRANSSDEEVGEGDSDSEGDSNEEADIRLGTTTVSLPLQGGVITPITTALPTGDYEQIEVVISGIRLRGTYDSQAFDVTLPLHLELEQHFSPAFHVGSDADHPNITFLIDVSSWLRNSDGSLIDPQLLASDATLRQQVLNRIRSSLRAFEDSDKDADEHDSDSD